MDNGKILIQAYRELSPGVRQWVASVQHCKAGTTKVIPARNRETCGLFEEKWRSLLEADGWRCVGKDEVFAAYPPPTLEGAHLVGPLKPYAQLVANSIPGAASWDPRDLRHLVDLLAEALEATRVSAIHQAVQIAREQAPSYDVTDEQAAQVADILNRESARQHYYGANKSDRDFAGDAAMLFRSIAAEIRRPEEDKGNICG